MLVKMLFLDDDPGMFEEFRRIARLASRRAGLAPAFVERAETCDAARCLLAIEHYDFVVFSSRLAAEPLRLLLQLLRMEKALTLLVLTETGVVRLDPELLRLFSAGRARMLDRRALNADLLVELMVGNGTRTGERCRDISA